MASFIKVLTPEYLHNVFIPRAFMAALSGENMKVATLTSRKRSGNQSWPIRLRKDDGGLYYFEEQGWIKFMKDHGLKIGEALQFEPKGGLNFDVVIFDKSYCEKTKFPVSLLKQVKEERRDIDDDEKEGLQIQNKERIGNENEYPAESSHRRSSHNAKHPKKDQNAFEAAKAYKPHSPYFMACVHTTNLNYQKPYFNIPSTFVSQIGKANPMGNVVTIRDSDQGMIWSVKVIYRNAGKRIFLSTGWNDLSVSKNLKVGDVCVFELDTEAKKNGIIILDVHIFRG